MGRRRRCVTICPFDGSRHVVFAPNGWHKVAGLVLKIDDTYYYVIGVALQPRSVSLLPCQAEPSRRRLFTLRVYNIVRLFIGHRRTSGVNDTAMPFLRDRFLKIEGCDVALSTGVALCLVLGGGDMGAPFMDNIAEACAALAILAWFWMVPAYRFASIPRLAWLAAGLIVALPLMQLVPLPPALWQALPGRELERQALALIGQENSWRPLTMVPGETINALLFAICTAMFVPMTAAAGRSGRTRVLLTVVVVAIISLLVGSQQLMGGRDNPFSFYGDTFTVRGFQWNRNSEADLLVITMLAVAACAAELLRLDQKGRWRRAVIVLTLCLTVVLALGTVLTGSRTGTVMLFPALVGQAVILFPHLRIRRSAGLMVLPVAAAIVLALLWSNPVLMAALNHFKDTHDLRPEVWLDTLNLLHRQAAWGAGLGSFGPMFATVERFDILMPDAIGHAYQDYAQLVVEAGMPGLLIFLAIVGVIAVSAWRGWSRPVAGSKAQYWFALISLLLFAGHSLWDYPLHSNSLACLAACCCGMLLAKRGSERGAA